MAFDPCPWRAALQARNPGWQRVTGPCLLIGDRGDQRACELCGRPRPMGASRGYKAAERVRELRAFDEKLRSRTHEKIHAHQRWLATQLRELAAVLDREHQHRDSALRAAVALGWLMGLAGNSPEGKAARKLLDAALSERKEGGAGDPTR